MSSNMDASIPQHLRQNSTLSPLLTTVDPFTPADWIRFGQMSASHSAHNLNPMLNNSTPPPSGVPQATQASQEASKAPEIQPHPTCASQTPSIRSQNSWNTVRESGLTNVDVVVNWLTTLGHYDMWRTGKPSKKSIGEMISKHLVDLDHPKRTGDQCKKKVTSIEMKFKEASVLRNATGQGVLDPDEAAQELAELGIEGSDESKKGKRPLSTEEKVLKICPWYWQLEPVLGERPFVKPLYVHETNGVPSPYLSDILQIKNSVAPNGDLDDLDPLLQGETLSDGSDLGSLRDSTSAVDISPTDVMRPGAGPDSKRRRASPSPLSARTSGPWANVGSKKARASTSSLPLTQMLSDYLPSKEERLLKDKRLKESELSQQKLSEKLVDAIGTLGSNCAEEIKFQVQKAKADLLTSLLEHGKSLDEARNVVKETFDSN